MDTVADVAEAKPYSTDVDEANPVADVEETKPYSTDVDGANSDTV